MCSKRSYCQQASCRACFTLLLPEASVAAAGPNLAEFGAMGTNVNDVKGLTCSMLAKLVSVIRGKSMLNTCKNKVVLPSADRQHEKLQTPSETVEADTREIASGTGLLSSTSALIFFQ